MIEQAPDLLLGSSENYGFEPPRRCLRLKRIAASNGNDYLLVRVFPPLDGVHFRRPGSSLEEVLLSSHLSGQSLFPVSHWPMPVYVLLPLVKNVQKRTQLANDEVELVAWAELYNAMEDLPQSPE